MKRNNNQGERSCILRRGEQSEELTEEPEGGRERNIIKVTDLNEIALLVNCRNQLTLDC